MAKMTFEVQMEGADRVLTFLKEFNKSYNEMNKTAEMTASQLNKGLNDMAASMKSINSATSGFGAFSKSLREAGQLTKEAFGDAQKALIDNYAKSVDALTTKLKYHYTEMATLREKAKQGGLSDDQQAQLLEHSQAAAALQSRVDWRQRAAAAYNFGQAHPNFRGFGGAFAGAAEQIGEMGGLGNVLLTPGGAMSLLRNFAPYMAVGGMAAFGLRAMQRSNEAGPQLAAQQATYFSQAANQSLQGDILTGLLLNEGIGAESRAREGRRGATEAMGQGFSRLTGGVMQILGGNFNNPFETAAMQNIQRQRELSRMEYGLIGEANQERLRLGNMFSRQERMFGADATSQLIRSMTSRGVSADAIAPVLNALAGAGASGTDSNAALAILRREGAVSDDMLSMIARRQAFAQSTGMMNNQTGTNFRFGGPRESAQSYADQVTNRYAAAGLYSAATAPQRALLDQSIAQQMQREGYTGFFNADQYGIQQTQAVGAAQANAGFAGVQGTSVALGVAANQQAGVQTAFDPRRVVMLRTLGRMGLNMREADYFISLGLEKPEVQQMLAQRTGKSADEIRSAIGGGQQAITTALVQFAGAGTEKTEAVVRDRLRQAQRAKLEKEGVSGPMLEARLEQFDKSLGPSVVGTGLATGVTDLGGQAAAAAAQQAVGAGYTAGAAPAGGQVEVSRPSTESARDATQAKWQSAAIDSAATLKGIQEVLQRDILEKISALYDQQARRDAEKGAQPFKGRE